jgi:hypothetical protein
MKNSALPCSPNTATDVETDDGIAGPPPSTLQEPISEGIEGGATANPHEQQLPPDRLRAACERLANLAESLDNPEADSFGSCLFDCIFGTDDDASFHGSPEGKMSTNQPPTGGKTPHRRL